MCPLSGNHAQGKSRPYTCGERRAVGPQGGGTTGTNVESDGKTVGYVILLGFRCAIKPGCVILLGFRYATNLGLLRHLVSQSVSQSPWRLHTNTGVRGNCCPHALLQHSPRLCSWEVHICLPWGLGPSLFQRQERFRRIGATSYRRFAKVT